jgi:hypothetical protein
MHGVILGSPAHPLEHPWGKRVANFLERRKAEVRRISLLQRISVWLTRIAWCVQTDGSTEE